MSTQMSAGILRHYPILCVDDDYSNLLTLRMVLEPEFTLICASSAEEAMNILETKSVAVLVTDQRMPGTTGVDLCEQARVRFPAVQRVLITAYSDMDTVIDAINRGGVFRYILKPWDPEELKMVLRESVARIHLEQVVQDLRQDIMARERDAALAAMRGKILHDIKNFYGVIATCSSSLQDLMERRQGEISERTRLELKEEVDDLNEAVAYVRHVQQTTGKAASMPDASPQRHPVQDVVEMVLGLVRAERAHNVDIEVECPDDMQMLADYTDISRVLVNLLTNAIQAIEESGKEDGAVRLSVQRELGAVLIEVTDNGPGIPEGLREQVFECGFTSRSELGGTGFGLAICRELAQANGGSLKLLRGQGEGTAFLLTIPDAVPGKELPRC